MSTGGHYHSDVIGDWPRFPFPDEVQDVYFPSS
jgi:hypothetical protein